MIEKLKEILDTVSTKVEEIEVLYTMSIEKHSIIDKMVVQLLHEIELENVDAVSMMKQIKELKGVLKLRRKYKDNVDYLVVVRSMLNKSVVKAYNQKITELEGKKEHRVFRMTLIHI